MLTPNDHFRPSYVQDITVIRCADVNLAIVDPVMNVVTETTFTNVTRLGM